MRLRQSRAARGFTLFEVLITLTLIGVIVALTLPAIDSGLKFNQRLETKARMQRLAQAIEIAYRQRALNFDLSPTTAVHDGVAWVTPGPTLLASFREILNLSGEDQTVLKDGFNRPFRLFISRRLTKLINGVNVPYHVLAIVSNQGGSFDGVNQLQQLHPGTSFNINTGVLTLGRGDVGLVINGIYIVQELLKVTTDRMQRVADSWSNYYRPRYAQDPGKTIYRDYFGQAVAGNVYPRKWHPTVAGGILANCGIIDPDPTLWGYPLQTLNIPTALGLTQNDLVDGWGRPLHAMNCGPGTRNPNAGPASSSPPYSAQIGTTLVDGTPYTMVVQPTL